MISYEAYLQSVLMTKQMELSETNIMHRIEVAKYNLKTDSLRSDIGSIERQLEDHKKQEESLK